MDIIVASIVLLIPAGILIMARGRLLRTPSSDAPSDSGADETPPDAGVREPVVPKPGAGSASRALPL